MIPAPKKPIALMRRDELVDYALALHAAHAGLAKALDEVAMMVSYIVTHTTLAALTSKIENGPQVVAPNIREVWELLNKMGDTARLGLDTHGEQANG